MRRIALPVVVALLVAAGAGVWWLMRRDLQMAVLTGALLLTITLAGAVLAWVLGHRTWGATLGVLVLSVVGAGVAYGLSINSTLESIPKIDAAPLQEGPRPEKEEQDTALNILLLGADNPHPEEDKPTVAELLADGTWDPGAYRSDSIILLHISADREQASMVSIPRDSYVRIYDAEGTVRDRNKINAAFSFYGPFGTLRTVENLSGLRIDHLAMIDFEGFRDVTTALGGVDVYVAETFYDPNNDYTWKAGWHHLEGEDALLYVRTRYGLEQGDFDRVRRQQNFLRALLDKLTDQGTIGDPPRLKSTIEAVVPYLTIDSTWTTGDLRRLALDLRRLRPSDISYATVGLDHYETIDGVGAANIIDVERVDELFAAVADDDLPAYLEKHPEDGLGSEQEVR